MFRFKSMGSNSPAPCRYGYCGGSAFFSSSNFFFSRSYSGPLIRIQQFRSQFPVELQRRGFSPKIRL